MRGKVGQGAHTQAGQPAGEPLLAGAGDGVQRTVHIGQGRLRPAEPQLHLRPALAQFPGMFGTRAPALLAHLVKSGQRGLGLAAGGLQLG